MAEKKGGEALADLFAQGAEEREEGLERAREGVVRPTEFADRIKALGDRDRAMLLAMTMESLRGSWFAPEGRIAIIQNISKENRPACLPAPLLDAVLHNSFMFNGHLIDGRVFRDGDREFGLSGNLAATLTGDDRVDQGKGYYGTYEEVWEVLGGRPVLEGDPDWDREKLKAPLELLQEEGNDLTFEEG